MMSQTVAELLVDVLEQIGVKQIFGLIGDSLNPLADAVKRSKIEWIGVRHEEGAALAAAGQPSLPVSSGCVPAQQVRAAPIWSLASTKRAVTTRRCSRFPATCPAKCTALTSFRPPRPISALRHREDQGGSTCRYRRVKNSICSTLDRVSKSEKLASLL
jgi:hypothetical protein